MNLPPVVRKPTPSAFVTNTARQDMNSTSRTIVRPYGASSTTANT